MGLVGCAITATRPIQEMSDASSALRSAREVNAENKSPELYRKASEWFFKARQEYQLKNFKEAKQYAFKARRYAEEAEFQSLIAGGTRTQLPSDPFVDPIDLTDQPKEKELDPEIEPKKNEIYIEDYQQTEDFRRKLELEKAKGTQILNQQPTPQPSSSPFP